MNSVALFCLISSIFFGYSFSAKSGVFFNENQVEKVLNILTEIYRNDLKFYNSIGGIKLEKEEVNYFFHSDDKIIPSVVAIGKEVNVYFYKNNNNTIQSMGNIENLSSFDFILCETKEDLKQFIKQANQVLLQLANESKHVPLIRILGPSYERKNRIKGLVERIKGEIPFKEYIQEALPILKTKNIKIEPRNNSENVAVIVESAIHPALELVVRNVMFYLESGWSLIIFHSEENEYFIKNVLKDLPNIEYRLPFFPIYSVPEYNQFMKKYEFYESLKAKKTLIFQTDSISIMLKRGMERFMQYDYVGAPWPWHETSGNGGFSLRSVAVMMKACNLACNYGNKHINEDLIFSGFVSRNYKLVPYIEAYKFSREHRVHSLDHISAEGGILDGHLALHQTWLHNDANTLRRIMKYSIEQLKKEI